MDDLNSLTLPELFQRLVAGPSLDRLLDLAIEEDLGRNRAGDITSESILSHDQHTTAEIVARKPGVVAGLAVVPILLGRFGVNVEFAATTADGESTEANAVLGTLTGSLLDMLKTERTLLNLLSRLSGIATAARRYVKAVAGTKGRICETRKTTPGLRTLEKYAARCGGAWLHRIGLYDAALYKDNHLAHLPVAQWTAALTEAIHRARSLHQAGNHRGAGPNQRFFVEVEVDTLEQLDRVLAIEPGLIDFVLLDNMSSVDLREAVRRRDAVVGGIGLEASGGIDLENVRMVAETGVGRISIGAITHSAPILDIGLDVKPGPGTP